MSTVRMGTLMPTPSVSVPQMTLSRPVCDSRSTRRRYFGSMPAWWTPMPWRTSFDRTRPKDVVKRKSPISSRILSFSSGVSSFRPVNACARSAASRCEKCTT